MTELCFTTGGKPWTRSGRDSRVLSGQAIPVNRHWRGAIWPCPIALFSRGGKVIRLSVWCDAKRGLDHSRMLNIAKELGNNTNEPCEYLGLEGDEVEHVKIARNTRKNRLTHCPNCGHSIR